MKINSLTLRLAIAAAVVIALSLAATGALLVFLFRGHVEARFDRDLSDDVEELVAASEISSSGSLQLVWNPVQPKFSRPGSGWYWRISRGGEVLYRSLSLQGMELHVPEAGKPEIAIMVGPTGRHLRVFSRPISLPGAEGRFQFSVAGPIAEIERDVGGFVAITTATLAALGLGLITAMIVQVRFGLLPLSDLRRALADIRAGQSTRMPASFPEEIEPVVDEVNALLEHNAALLERARTQAGNLAHALKHPLTVMANELRHVEGERGAIMGEQVTAMRGSVDRYLSRARAAGPAGATGMRTPVGEVVEGLRFSMDRLYRDRGLEVAVEAGRVDELVFAGDAQDLEEMLGNLMDNACKWAQAQVRVTGSMGEGRIEIAVEDDGAGIDAADREAVLARGKRLDERVAGAGLGLDIVREIAELYRGRLVLGASELGGLRAELDLPGERTDSPPAAQT